MRTTFTRALRQYSDQQVREGTPEWLGRVLFIDPRQ